ncbi:MAG: ArsR family transcriptional regulator [Candidatus Thermoplasmatota archaeon]
MASRDTLTKRQQTFADLLFKAGVSQKLARSLAALASGEELTSRELEVIGKLRQPEVSIVMKEMRRRHWVKMRAVRGEGKGRPCYAYRLAVPVQEIVSIFEREERSRQREVDDAIARLKSLAKKF